MKRLSKLIIPFALVFTLGLPAGAQKSENNLLNLFIDLSKKVNPAVVNISTTQVIRGMPRGYGMPVPMPNDPFRQFFEEFMGPGQMAPPTEKVQSLGSGFIIDTNGTIVTNYHVIQNASDIQVQLTENSKRTFKAKVIGSDARTDIALIRISANQKLIAVPLGDSDKVEVGEWVAAFGNPFGHGHSVTKGIISAKDRDIELEQSYYPFLQTDASINPGNSGGPLVNTNGEVIGVNAAIDARGQGLGFAIPINVVKKLIPALESKGKIIRGFLGVNISNIDEKMVKRLHLKDDRGAIIINVGTGSPAERAGIEPYDVVTNFNGKEVTGARSLQNMVADTPVGQTVTMNILRDGKPMTLKAKISEHSDETVAGESESEGGNEEEVRGVKAPYNLGFNFANLTPNLARELELQEAPPHSVVIVGIRPNSLAAQAGLDVGDLILDINRHAVHSTRDVTKALRKDNNSLRIIKGGQPMIVFMGS